MAGDYRRVLTARSEATRAVDAGDDSGYSADGLAGAIDHHVHDPYELYEKAAAGS
jgi:hypothetical protein